LSFKHPAQQIAFQDYVDAVMDAERRLKRVEEQIVALLPEWNLRPVVDALQAMRGIALINAVVLVAEVGDFTRFSNPRQFRTIAATSHFVWLISITAINVLSCSKAARDLLASKDCIVGALHR
jgi:hypothetical protein